MSHPKFDKLLIDGDIIVYRSGFACHRKEYIAEDGASWRYKKDFNSYVKEKGLSPTPRKVIERVEPVENALHNVKVMLNGVREVLGCQEYELFLTEDPQWRDALGTLKKYKGNRDPAHKPEHYMEIKAYMKKVWKAIEVQGWEADDELAIRQTDKTCIVSLDKDLDQIPGWHYNWVNEELYFVSPIEGSYMLWLQMLQGDATDNIMGIPGLGPKGAEKLLEMCRTAPEMESVVKLKYEQEFPLDLCLQYGYESWKDIYEENLVLLSIGNIELLKEMYEQAGGNE